MTKLLALITVVTQLHLAHAGPFCGRGVDVAPAEETTLPLAPTIGMWFEDFYYDGARKSKAKVPRMRATIDGKAVSFTVKDVRGVEGIIRYLKITSRKAGRLEIWAQNAWTKEMDQVATYTTSAQWKAPDKAVAVLSHGRDIQLAPYFYKGELAVLTIDAPVIGFSMRWRKDEKDTWKTRPFPARVTGSYPEPASRTELRLGETMCGMVENLPMADLKTGIEIELTARLPDGTTLKITEGIPTPLAMPPLTKEQLDADEREERRKHPRPAKTTRSSRSRPRRSMRSGTV